MSFQRQKITIDIDQLFPGETIKIGESILTIRPLSFYQIAMLTKQGKELVSMLKEQGVTLENFNKPENIFKCSAVLMDHFPSILEESANIDIEDLQKLPIDIIVQIVEKVVTVNMKSKDDLIKNFNSLIGKILPEEVVKSQEVVRKKK
jgi:hypothetical protein